MIHKEKFRIRANETDPNQNVTMPALASLLQEAAWTQTVALGVSVYDLIRKGLTWVLFRMSIELDQAVKHGQEIEIATWPSGLDQKYVFRDFKIYQNNDLVGKAKTSWVVFDINKRKVTQVPDFIRDIKLDPTLGAVEYQQDKLPIVEDYELSIEVKAGWHDIDINRHVNNISYLKWIIETMPVAFLQKNRLQHFDIIFRSECSLGDDVICLAKQESNEQVFLHRLHKDGKDLVIAKTTWQNNKL